MAVTLKEVATSLGVSTSVVSKVLNHSASTARVGNDTRRRVIERAEKLGYRPNAFARCVRRGRSHTVGLLLPSDLTAAFMPAYFVQSLAKALDEKGMRLSVTVLPDQKLTSEGYVPQILREISADALLINYIGHIPRKMIQLIGQHHIPAIWVNVKRRADCVYPDDRAASRMATQRLLDLGHRRIAYLHFGSIGHYSTVDRAKGYEAVIREAGLTPRMVRASQSPDSRAPGDAASPGSRARSSAGANAQSDAILPALRRLLAPPDRPTALVCYSEREALAAIVATKELGLGVPRDLSVVVFYQHLLSSPGFPVSTVAHLSLMLAEGTVSALLRKIAEPGRALAPHPVAPVWREGGTCATAPPEGARNAHVER